MATLRPLSPPSPSSAAMSGSTTLTIQTSHSSSISNHSGTTLTNHASSNTISYASIPSPTTTPTRPRQQSTTTTTTTSNSIANNTPLIVRALYDYHSPDSSNLSFQAGTLIRVLTQLPTGWWDGCIDGERGWFPRNFVTEVDMDELGFGDEEEDFLDTNDSSDDTSGDESDGERALAEDMGTRGVSQDLLTTEEFTWVPQADKEGRTFFVNTQNGATSWELPSARIYLDDWDESRVLSDEEEEEDDGGGGGGGVGAQPRSSLDSENSDVLMLGPINPELTVPAFKEFNVLSLSEYLCLIIATFHSIHFIETILPPFKDKFRQLLKSSLLNSHHPSHPTSRSNLWYPLPIFHPKLTFGSRYPAPASSYRNRQTHRLSIHLPPSFFHPRHRRHCLLHSPYLCLYPPLPQRPAHRTIHPLQSIPSYGCSSLFSHYIHQDCRIRLVS